MVGDRLEDVWDRANRRRHDDQIGVLDRRGHVPGHVIGRLHPFGLLLLREVDIEADHLHLLLLARSPVAQPQPDRGPDEAEADDRDLFHVIFIPFRVLAAPGWRRSGNENLGTSIASAFGDTGGNYSKERSLPCCEAPEWELGQILRSQQYLFPYRLDDEADELH